MKATKSILDLRAYLAFVVFSVVLLTSCNPSNNILPDPPVTYTKSAVAIKPAEKITMTSATVVAKVVPNENDTKVSFEYKAAESDWSVKDLPLTFSGKDSVTVTFDLSTLKLGTEYSFRVKAKNAAGEVISSESKFVTYAVADFDGNLYHTVTIGSQTWLQENFKGTHYANGDAIANVTNLNSWSNLTTGAYCWYNNDLKIGEVYGGLYNWYVGVDPRGLIVGWHTPSNDDWSKLVLYLDGNKPANYVTGLIAGPKVMETGTSHWKTTSQIATNTTGFTALPNGRLAAEMSNKENFVFRNLEEDAVFWSTSDLGTSALGVEITKDYSTLVDGLGFYKNRGLGLRLMKN